MSAPNSHRGQLPQQVDQASEEVRQDLDADRGEIPAGSPEAVEGARFHEGAVGAFHDGNRGVTTSPRHAANPCIPPAEGRAQLVDLAARFTEAADWLEHGLLFPKGRGVGLLQFRAAASAAQQLADTHQRAGGTAALGGQPSDPEDVRLQLAVRDDALRRLRQWGGFSGGQGWSATVCLPVVRWIDGGMVDELPALPEWAATEPVPGPGEH